MKNDRNRRNLGRTRRVLLLALFAWVLPTAISAAGCSGTTATQSTATQGAGGGADGRYHQGVYLCCAKGEGDACCADEEPGMCFQYGGVTEDCAPEGGNVEGKDICALCCPGLTRIGLEELTDPNDPESCQPTAPPSLFVCAACGDGQCGTAENTCNCPADCPPKG